MEILQGQKQHLLGKIFICNVLSQVVEKHSPYSGVAEIKSKKVKWSTTFSRPYRFNCSHYGLCCFASNAIVNPLEEAKIKSVSKLDVIAEKTIVSGGVDGSCRVMKGTTNNHCIFRNECKCEIYSARPKSCRSFPFVAHWYTQNEMLIDIQYGCSCVFGPEAVESDNEFGCSSISDIVIPSSEFLEELESDRTYLKTYLNLAFYFKYALEKLQKQNIAKCADFVAALQVVLIKQKTMPDETDFETEVRESVLDFAEQLFSKLKATSDFYSPSNIAVSFSKASPYSSQNLATRELYIMYAEEDNIIFESSEGKRTFVPISKISIKPLAYGCSEFLADYFLAGISRAGFRIALAKKIRDMHRDVRSLETDTLIASLDVLRKHILVFGFVTDSIAEKNAHAEANIDDVKEAIMMTDASFLNAPDVYIKTIKT